MEKNNMGKILAIIALIVAIAGLSLGFAAFSSYLKIESTASVSAGAGNWNVGFSTDDSDVEDVTTPGEVSANSGNPGKLNVTKYTISQKTNATLSTASASSVSYNLSVLNKGKVNAYLDSITFASDPITCSNATGSGETLISGEGTTGAGATISGGNSTTISPADCAKMFSVSLSIGGTAYTSTPVSVTANTITPGNSTPVILTISYKNDATAKSVADTLDGDIEVNVGPITVVYTSTNPSPSGGGGGS